MKAIFPESPQDWTSAKPEKIYHNSKTGRYTSTVVVDSQVIPENLLQEQSEKYYENFILNICANLNKARGMADFSDKIVVLNNYIDPSPLIKERLLLGIDASEFNNLRELVPSETTSSSEVVYDLGTFFKRIQNIAQKFEDYQSQYISNIFLDSTNSYLSVDFLMESESLYKFGNSLKSLIESNDLNISRYSQIQLSFNASPTIITVRLIKGLETVRLKYLIQDFLNSYPQNSRQTMTFVSRLPELSEDIKSNEENYQTIVEKYFLNTAKRGRASTNLISRSLKDGKSASVNNKDIEVEFASLKEINSRSTKLLQREILNSVYRTPCMTPEVKDQIDAKLEKDAAKKANFAKKLSLSVSDAFFENLPEVLQKVALDQADEALKDLGRNFLNRMGVCGIGDLTSLVTNTVFAYMNEQEYVDELSKCAVQNLNNDKVSKLWAEIQRLDRNAEITERYRKFVGDTIPPWKTGGYTPPDYRKSLATDNPLLGQYTLKINTPAEDPNVELRFVAFKDSITASIGGGDLLNILVNTFPDEMGWLNFFTDMTKGILNKCRVPTSLKASFEANWCQKRVEFPEIKDVPKSGGSFIFKPSDLSTILVEEIKNVIINLTVRTVISSMQQMFEIIAAGTSFDGDYFKQRQYIPDLFQNENSIQTEISNFCAEATSNFKAVNESVRSIFQEKYPSQYSISPLSLTDIDIFLKSCSVALSRYDKIRLYRGEAENIVYQKVSELTNQTNISPFFKNNGDIEQFFLSLGQLLDINNIERDFYNSVREGPDVTVEYCGEDFDSLGMAYARNKPEISDKQIQKMKNTLKGIQRDKICFAVNAVGNPRGAIIGQVGEIIQSKTGPVFGRISKEMVKLFEPVIENKMRVISKNYRNDLYNSQGLFDLIRADSNGIGENRRVLQSFFGVSISKPTVTSLENSKISSTHYSPDKFSINIQALFKEGLPGVIYLASDNKIIIGSSDTIEIPTKKYEGEFESGANRIRYLLQKNQYILRSSLNEKISRNFISNGILTSVVDEYFQDIKDKLLASPRTYVGNWEEIYLKVQSDEESIPLILGEKKAIEETKNLYRVLEIDQDKKDYAPFSSLKSKEEIVLAYSSFLMLVHTVTSEMLLKGLPIYEAFGVNLLNNYELLGEYIYHKFENTIDEFSNDRRRIKTLEKLVQVSIIASNEGLIPPFTPDLQDSIDKLNINITNWIQGAKGTKVKNLEKNEADMEKIARFFVKNVSKAYIGEFQKGMSEIEENKFPSINKTDTVYKYIFNESLLTEVVDVVSDVDNVGILKKGLRLEKYIKLEGATEGLISGVQNLDDFRKYLLDNPAIEGKISDNWSQWSFGMRISSVFDFDAAGISEGDISLGPRNSLKGFTLISDSDSSEAEKYFLSPIVVYEKKIEDTEINFKLMDQYNESSMKKDLSEIDDFLKFYYRGMNIENLISLATIYINEEFGSFLANTAGLIPPSTVTNWETKGSKILNDTKKFIVNTLEKI